ncbi:hypothetical protein FKW77_009340 [Venturia effusa]|uniref:Uncharacterized protein n=1 Tax=Venturia effusa TaxID=50376 RepID=A0A517LEJ8_9PEZI|nr:hypothetical protein FKW77_009340 [Venturia effusa]
MGDNLAESADGGGFVTSNAERTLPENLEPAFSYTPLKSTIEAQPGRCMLLELPRELKDMIWKQVFSFDEVFHFHSLCAGIYGRILGPSLETLLTCKQVYEEGKDFLWTVNTFQITVAPDEFEDFEAAQKHPLWSRIRIIEFEGTFVQVDSPTSLVNGQDDNTLAVSQAVNALESGKFRIKRLVVDFLEYYELQPVLAGIRLFKKLKVADEACFRISAPNNAVNVNFGFLSLTRDVIAAAIEAFDSMLGSIDILNGKSCWLMFDVVRYIVYRCDTGFAKLNQKFDGDAEIERMRRCADANELDYEEEISDSDETEDGEEEEEEEEEDSESTERLFVQLRAIVPSDVPSDMQLSLAGQLRDLAHDLELQARWTALPLSPTTDRRDYHAQDKWQFSGPAPGSAEGLSANLINGNDPDTDDKSSIASWETLNAEVISLASIPSLPYDPNAPFTPPNPRFRPYNPYEEYEMGIIEAEPGEFDTTLGFNNPPSEPSDASQFSQSPGPDRRVGVCVPGRVPCTPPPAHPTKRSSTAESGPDSSTPLLLPKEKKAWWEPDSAESASSSPFESLRSRNSLSVDVSFNHDSDFTEGGTENFTPENIFENSDEEHASTEPSSFLIDGTEVVAMEDPFWGKTPIRYPTLNDPNESEHNQLTKPINRSHKLLLDLQAARRHRANPTLPPPLPLRPSITLNMIPISEAAKLPLPPSPAKRPSLTNHGRVKGRPLNKPSMWNRLADGVLRVIGHKKHSPDRKDGKGTAMNAGGISGRTLRKKKSLARFFEISPSKKDR